MGAVNIVFAPCSAITRQNWPGVRRADRFALVEDRRRAHEQRRVDDVGVPDDPADVGRGEHRLARADGVDVGHRPGHRHRVATAVAHHALRLPGGARGVEDVERVGRRDGHRLGRLGASPSPRPSRRRPGPSPPAPADAAGSPACRACARPARSPRPAGACTRAPACPRCRTTRRRSTTGVASSIRTASSRGANPPNTTECTAPEPGAGEHRDRRPRAPSACRRPRGRRGRPRVRPARRRSARPRRAAARSV